MSVTAIQEEILGLPATERARLIDLLWDSISEPQQRARESAWAAESERRIDAYEAGKLSARNAADVLADLKKGLRR
jgi:putative addiction module component (TIGR02574 family)